MSNDTALAIGDRGCDILGAKKVGIKTCLYNINGAIKGTIENQRILIVSEFE